MLIKGKVSIIVPIYKVESYIHRCLTSIIHQTYSELEIILVNDGSPDRCGEIADAYNQIDSRIKVIHKENGGLSDARNAGMKEVTGEYTMFVDSDDWLQVNMVETMIAQAAAYKADIVQSSFYYAYGDKLLIDQRHFKKDDPPVVYDRKQLMTALIENEKVKNFAWGKLYKTKLIQDIPFKKGVLFEDVYWAHHVMHRVDTYLISHQPFYYYYQRDDSIVASYTPRNLDMVEGWKERHLFITAHYPELLDVSYQMILKQSLIHYDLLIQNRKMDRDKFYRKKIASYIELNIQELRQATKTNKDLYLQLRLFLLHPAFKVTYLALKKGLRFLRVLPSPQGLVRARQLREEKVAIE